MLFSNFKRDLKSYQIDFFQKKYNRHFLFLKKKMKKRKTSTNKSKTEKKPKVEKDKVDDIEDLGDNLHSLGYHQFNKEEIKGIRESLLDWYEKGKRDLPWRKEDKDKNNHAYRVYISEIMLQQVLNNHFFPSPK